MDKRAELIELVKNALASERFVKFVLSKPSNGGDVRKVTARVVQIKDQEMLSVVSSHQTKDVTKNHTINDGFTLVREMLENSFENATLLSLEGNYQLEKTPKGKDKIHHSAPTSKKAPSKTHNHVKKRLISKDRPFLKTLGLVGADGEIKSKMNGKYNQVESFINVLSKAINESQLNQAKKVSVYDMGAGSAYVSFAIYDYVRNTLQREIELTGVDINKQLVERNNKHAKELGFMSSKFIHSSISDLKSFQTDVVVALHACNTATDDALYTGIQSNAQLIIASPCCHQELRQKMNTPKVLEPVHKFGTHKEQEAEMLTDTIRTLTLEINGYKTNLFEFVSDEHSGKNNIIVATKKQSNQDKNKFVKQLAEIKEFYGLGDDLYLESLF